MTSNIDNSLFNISDRAQWLGQTHTRRRNLRHLIAISHHATLLLGKIFPSAFPLLYVMGYPKSGTSWVAQLVGDYLRLPHPQHYILPIGFPAVIQGHESISSRYHAAVYVLRDGRDVLISGFHHLKSQTAAGGGKRYQRAFFNKIDRQAPLSDVLTSFIEHAARYPFSGRLTWGDHVIKHLKMANDRIIVVSYEDLLTQGSVELNKLMSKLCGTEADAKRVDEALHRYQFEGKKPSQGDSYYRKGQFGDWMNHFNAESAKAFDHYFGHALVMAGYESDSQWVNSFSKSENRNS